MNSMFKSIRFICAYIFCLCTPYSIYLQSVAQADEIYWGCNYPTEKFHFGEVNCTQQVSCETFELQCLRGKELLFVANDFADTIFEDALVNGPS